MDKQSSMLPLEKFYYKTSTDENSIGSISKMFDGLDGEDFVIAHVGGPSGGITHDSMTKINNHLSASKCWAAVEDWAVEVEYTICHQDGDVIVSDNKNTNDPIVRRMQKTIDCVARCNNGVTEVGMERWSKTTPKYADFNMKKCSFVKIKRTKKFKYSTGRSSWIYTLGVKWEGITKEDAELEDKQFYVSIESGDNKVSSSNIMYTAVSFMEKILDIASIGEDTRQHLCFLF